MVVAGRLRDGSARPDGDVAATAKASEPRGQSAGKYVPEFDGVKGIGIIMVLIHHAQLGISGAFLGVSQFFTMSGFLITTIIVRSVSANGNIDVSSFLGRRYRRLLPGSMLTLAGVVLYGATVATEQQLNALPGQIVASLAQVANWHFVITDASYVDLFQAPSPVQHFWSLAIEEQFYLFMPVLVVTVMKLSGSLRVLTGVLTGLTLGSAVWTIYLFNAGATVDRMYYGTDTRASEILIGCVAALVLFQRPPKFGRTGQRALGVVGVVCFSLTIWAFFTFHLTDRIIYQGGLPIMALTTVVLVAALLHGRGPMNRILSFGPICMLGRLTYGIYLFHWPIYLYLTEERVGFGGWPLLWFRASIVIGLAFGSDRFLESPIRYRRPTPGNFKVQTRFVIGLLVIALGAFALNFRDVETNLAGLEGEASAAPLLADDAPFNVVAIADSAGMTAVNELAAVDRVNLTATIPFSCSPNEAAARCDNWEPEWSEVIEAKQPDVVLFQVSDWDGSGLIDSTSSADIEENLERMKALLQSGIDIMSAQGATITWWDVSVGFADAKRRETDPFHRAWSIATQERTEVRALPDATTAEDAAAGLERFRRVAADGLPRVLVVGDSVSLNIGYGLEQWAVDSGDALVWSAGVKGCGLARGGVKFESTGREIEPSADCESVDQRWIEQIDTFDPDLVIVISSGEDLRARRLPEWDKALRPGDVDFDAYLLNQYRAAVGTFTAKGAPVVWMTSPCMIDRLGRFKESDGSSPFDRERIVHFNSAIIERLAAENELVTTFDLDAVLCPGGEFAFDLAGVDNVRPDGVHLSAEGTEWLAQNYAAELLERSRSADS